MLERSLVPQKVGRILLHLSRRMLHNDCHCFFPWSLKKYQCDDINLTVIVFALGFLYCNSECKSMIAVVFVAIAVTLLGSLDFIGIIPAECLPCDTCSTFHCCIHSNHCMHVHDHCPVFDCCHCNLVILVSLPFLPGLCNIGPIVEHW